MIDDPINTVFDPSDADLTYEHYLETRRRANVTPVSRVQAEKLITEWSEAIESGLAASMQH